MHSFLEVQLLKPTNCMACGASIWCFGKQGLRCTNCEFLCHGSCAKKLQGDSINCTARPNKLSCQFNCRRLGLRRHEAVLEVDGSTNTLRITEEGRLSNYKHSATLANLKLTPGQNGSLTVDDTSTSFKVQYQFKTAAELAHFEGIVRSLCADALPISSSTGTPPSDVIQQLQQAADRGVIPAELFETLSSKLLFEAAQSGKPAFTLTTPIEWGTKVWYDWEGKEWREERIELQLDRLPFAEGTFRAAYRMVNCSAPAHNRCCAAKMAKEGDTFEEIDTQFRIDAKMQACCQVLARAYNENRPPKMVMFLEAFIVVRSNKALPPQQQLLFVEPFISGKYIKHNNNAGFVSPEDRCNILTMVEIPLKHSATSRMSTPKCANYDG
eukprot:TRINITY_DN3012_c0_g2_i1.p1 TRINITY_DN3012_c0_g2~~TRINITY_DN3012_c0_g2_i1.p1  ORF type:complete len:396 (+),score=47.49 TRINITY_DN3012_c0_g2_i1:40-1188(+)